ncbi:MAG: hypothetical protein SF123_10040 [Chloroflexota bacterium]|nr:hypothetical protein [Chloroflexota bacterium]
MMDDDNGGGGSLQGYVITCPVIIGLFLAVMVVIIVVGTLMLYQLGSI